MSIYIYIYTYIYVYDHSARAQTVLSWHLGCGTLAVDSWLRSIWERDLGEASGRYPREASGRGNWERHLGEASRRGICQGSGRGIWEASGRHLGGWVARAGPGGKRVISYCVLLMKVARPTISSSV